MAFSTHADAKAAGWFSRKHRTNELHLVASEAKATRFATKIEGARARQAESNKLSPAQKLARLPKDGAKKERAKLLARLSAPKAEVVTETVKAPKNQTPKGKARKS